MPREAKEKIEATVPSLYAPGLLKVGKKVGISISA